LYALCIRATFEVLYFITGNDLSRTRANVKEVSKLHDRIQKVLLMGSSEGLTRSNILNALGWKDNPTNKQRLGRHLEMLLEDKASGIKVKKDGVVYAYGEKIPKGTKPIFWQIERAGKIKSLDLESIALVTAREAAKYFLPPSQRKWLEEQYQDINRTGHRLEKLKKWQEKVSVKARYPSIYPNLGGNYERKEAIIYDALQRNEAFTGTYDFKQKTRLTLFPVRLLRREQVQYVVCSASTETPEFKEYAIHRLAGVKHSNAKGPQEFNSSKFIQKHSVPGVIGPWGKYNQLKIRIIGPAVNHFTEMRFHEDEQSQKHLTTVQVEQDDNENVIATILTIKEVDYTYELRTWLLGLGMNATVIEPANIRNDIKAEIKEMIGNYNLN